MDTKQICKECGAPLAADAPQGLCPNCLMKVAMGSEAGNPAGRSGERKPAPPPEEIARHFPQFEIISLLGQGGMGAVYKARQPALDRFVALKILPAHAATDAGFAERFNREARALAKLSHPHIVAVYDFGQVDGLHYLVMEYVDGLNLRQLQQTGKLPPREALQIIPQICEALQFAHDEGVVHRDIKPENVMLDRKGRVKIADFGLARILGREPESWRLTGAKDFMGTPHYMAPEQIERPQAVDHRADIYSLGVVFYEMLTGELPLGKFAPPSKKVQVDVRLDEVVLHALEQEPERRYQKASEVKTDVESIANTTPPQRSSEEMQAAARRQQVLRVKSALFFVAAACFVIAAALWAGLGNQIAAVLSTVAAIGFSIAGYGHLRAAALNAPPARSISAQEVEAIRHQVKGPAIGLVVTGILNWITIPLVVIITAGIVGGKDLDKRLLVWVPLMALVLSSAMIVAGLKMKRLEAYGLAVIGSILAMLVTPGNLLGLPIGIWALVVLGHREVRNAFGKPWPLSSAMAGSPQTSRTGVAWKVAAVVGAAMLVLFLAVSVSVFAYFMARSSNAREQARRAQAAALAEQTLIRRIEELKQQNSTRSPSTFGPELERVLYSVTAQRPIRLLDLDGGEQIELPAERENGTEEQFFHRMSERGADLMAQSHRTAWTLTTSLKLASLVGSAWSNATPATLRETLTLGTNSLRREDTVFGYDQYHLDASSTFPLTFAFETRQGGLGVLQITGFTESSPTSNVRIRYKLAQGGSSANGTPAPQAKADDVADVTAVEHFAGGDTNKVYYLIARTGGSAANTSSAPLLLVLPGGDGGRDFQPFIKRIRKNALPDGYLVAQLVAPKWDNNQFAKLVWPTEKSRYPAMQFSTEEFVNAVVADIEKRHLLDSRRIFTLSWSSGGPAGYAISLYPGTRVNGSFIAMSVFKPDQLPELNAAKAHAYYLLHSPEDFIPMRMPELARDTLTSNGAKVHLQTYPGGHGWHGDVYEMIGDGIRWLEQQTTSPKNLERANP